MNAGSVVLGALPPPDSVALPVPRDAGRLPVLVGEDGAVWDAVEAPPSAIRAITED